MKPCVKNSQSGIALLTSLFGLMLLSAIALGLVYVARTEGMVNFNYRNEQVAYFAAKAGVEEARDRMMPSNANYFGGLLPTAVPPANASILYLLNEGNATGSVQPWNLPSTYADDELCHDGYAFSGLNAVQPDLRCQATPSGSSWYTTAASTAPWSGTSAAMAYKWVRVGLKLNNSEQDYPVSGSSSAQVCWDGSNENVLTTTSCQQMSPSMTPVYLLTSLGVAPNGARKMVQAEVALNPTQPFIYGMFAQGIGCSILSLGGGATTDSFTTANGGTYASTHTNTGGDVGSNGNVTANGSPTQIGGSVGVLAVPPLTTATEGPCNLANYTTLGGAGMIANPANTLNTLNQPVQMPTPPAPNPVPPNTSYTPPSCGGSGKLKSSSGVCMVPGTYGNISLTGGADLTLAPGVYNINSISVAGNSSINISSNPPGQVIFNVAGAGTATPIDLTGSSVSNPTGIANNFQILYGGTGTVKVAGGSSTYMVVYAPNANVTLKGGSDFYGAIAGSSIDDSGGVNFHYDRNVHLNTTPSSGPLVMISFRDVTY